MHSQHRLRRVVRDTPADCCACGRTACNVRRDLRHAGHANLGRWLGQVGHAPVVLLLRGRESPPGHNNRLYNQGSHHMRVVVRDKLHWYVLGQGIRAYQVEVL